MSYHLTQTYVRLFFPQTHHHMHGSYYVVYNIGVSMYLADHLINITIDREHTNLPIVYNSFVSDNDKKLTFP